VGIGKVIHFHGVVPPYREKMDYKLAKSADKLADRLGEANVTELLYLKRVNILKKSFFGSR
jgi:hypothetical protein